MVAAMDDVSRSRIWTRRCNSCVSSSSDVRSREDILRGDRMGRDDVSMGSPPPTARRMGDDNRAVCVSGDMRDCCCCCCNILASGGTSFLGCCADDCTVIFLEGVTTGDDCGIKVRVLLGEAEVMSISWKNLNSSNSCMRLDILSSAFFNLLSLAPPLRCIAVDVFS